MAKGDGGIQELRRGVWRVSVSAGNNPATGKRQRVTRVVHGTKQRPARFATIYAGDSTTA